MIKMAKMFRNNLCNIVKKYIFGIFSQIYSNNMQSQYYSTTNINDIRICNHKIQSLKSYFLNTNI